jgi:pyruvate kinase
MLKEEYSLQGIKAEFEAEGSSFRDLLRLRRITDRAGVRLYLKIAGVEAVRDIKDSLEIGVDGLIAPMCESRFGVSKFIGAYRSIYKEHKIHLSINVETKNAVNSIDEIIEEAEGYIDNITIGRTDLSGSYFQEEIVPDSDFILNKVLEIGRKLQSKKLTLTMGGSLSAKTIQKLASNSELLGYIKKLETRKVMLPTKEMVELNDSVRECLKFEELYILSKKEFSDLAIESEVNRLTSLKMRLY